MHRPLAAACAACLTTMITYPLDTIRLSKQINIHVKPGNLYKGVVIDTASS